MKPIYDLEFWMNRLELAQQHNNTDAAMGDFPFRLCDKAHKKIIEKEQVSGKVLDVGCGVGRAAAWFENYVGVDFVPEFIRIAQERYPNKKFVAADFRKLPFEDSEFDWGVCLSVRHMVKGNLGEEAWLEVQKEIQRVCKRILFLEFGEPENYEII